MKFNSFAWYDLVTTDVEAASAFYRKVVGWDIAAIGAPDRPYYTLGVAPGVNVGGMMPMPDGACANGMSSSWRGYILVDDVDGYTERVKTLGGAVHREPEDIPGILRFSVVADPHGAMFILFKGMSKTPPNEAERGAPGTFGWNELHAGNGGEAFDFYASLLGWRKDRDFEMGQMGVYRLFAAGGETLGGMMTKAPDRPAPFWLFYINVDAIDGAVERVKEGGGKVLQEPHQVPTGSWIAQCADPQGARFAMVASKR